MTDLQPHEKAALVNEQRKGRATGKQLIGKPVISLQDGKEQGQTHDVIYNAQQGRLVGFTMLKNAGLFAKGDTFYLAAADIYALGEDAITIQTGDGLQKIDGDVNEIAAQAGSRVLGKRLMTEDGKFLGAIDDVLIDRKTLNVVAYEVSGGVFQDLMRGQSDVPINHIVSIGEDVVVVPPFVAEQTEDAKGGLAAVASATSVKATELGHEAALGFATARTQASEAIERKEIEYTIGKEAAREVRDDAGNILASPGQFITQTIVDRAVAAGKMHALAASVVAAQASDAGDSIKAKASALNEQAKSKIGDYLVGKTTGRAVLMDNGAVLVPAGHVITQVDADAAQAAGKLDDLSAAVGQASVDAAKTSVGNAYDSAKTGVTNAYDAATAPAPVVTTAAPVAVPAAASGVTIVIEHPENVTVQTDKTDPV